MKTPTSSDAMSASFESIENGLSQESSGRTESASASPEYTFAIATAANTSSAPTCAKIITFWRRADSSVPRMQTTVMTAMIPTASRVTATLEPAAPSAPNSKYV